MNDNRRVQPLLESGELMDIESVLYRLRTRDRIAGFLRKCGLSFTTYSETDEIIHLDSLRHRTYDHRTYDDVTLIFDNNEELVFIHDYERVLTQVTPGSILKCLDQDS
jgi:hypothetical protein